MTKPAATVINEFDCPPHDEDDDKARMRYRNLVDADCAPDIGFMQGTVRLDAHDGEALHHHQVAETAFVLSGTGRVTLDGRDHEVAPGDMVVIPAGSVHGWRAGAEPLDLLYTFPTDRFEDVEYHFAE